MLSHITVRCEDCGRILERLSMDDDSLLYPRRFVCDDCGGEGLIDAPVFSIDEDEPINKLFGYHGGHYPYD